MFNRTIYLTGCTTIPERVGGTRFLSDLKQTILKTIQNRRERKFLAFNEEESPTFTSRHFWKKPAIISSQNWKPTVSFSPPRSPRGSASPWQPVFLENQDGRRDRGFLAEQGQRPIPARRVLRLPSVTR